MPTEPREFADGLMGDPAAAESLESAAPASAVDPRKLDDANDAAREEDALLLAPSSAPCASQEREPCAAKAPATNVTPSKICQE
jgi:hypothetical protein